MTALTTSDSSLSHLLGLGPNMLIMLALGAHPPPPPAIPSCFPETLASQYTASEQQDVIKQRRQPYVAGLTGKVLDAHQTVHLVAGAHMAWPHVRHARCTQQTMLGDSP